VSDLRLTSPLPPPVRVPLTVVPEHDCPYLPDRQAQMRAFSAPVFSGELYHRFMDAGFRRAGSIFYQPVCTDCRACQSLRIAVGRFRPGRSQRRCRQRNQDLAVSSGEPDASEEKFQLYHSYVSRRHRGPMVDDDRATFESFLYRSPVHTIEICYRDRAGRLLAVGICDACSTSLSSVYFYFDPDQPRRSLGTFGVLMEIELAVKLSIPYYYMGYWVEGCRAMEYKSCFHPHELLMPDGTWREAGPA
jgi:leucyl-tRNA---protein transferase